MSIGILIHGLANEHKTIIRHKEQATKKLIKAKYALAFNKTCINENTLPKYSNVRLHDPAARDEAFTKDYRKKLVEYQLHTKEETCKTLQKRLDKLNVQFYDMQIDKNLAKEIETQLNVIAENTEQATKVRTT